MFRTQATDIEIDVLPTRYVYAGVPPRPAGVYDLLIDGLLVRQSSAAGGDIVTIDMAAGTASKQSGPVGTLRFTGSASGVARYSTPSVLAPCETPLLT